MSAKQKWFFLRGLVREAGHWSGFLERFEKAFPGREAVPLDLPGNGIHCKEKSPLTVGAMTQLVREEFLRKKSGDDHLFALSLGAMVALEWLHRWPGDIKSAVLVNTSVRGLSPLHHRLRPLNYGRILSMMFARDLASVERGILAMTSNERARHAELEAEWVKIQSERPVSRANSVRQLIAAARFHPPREKPALPLLILNGAGDQLVDPRCSQALASHWKLPLEVHPSAGHDLTLDAPDWVIAKIKTFKP